MVGSLFSLLLFGRSAREKHESILCCFFWCIFLLKNHSMRHIVKLNKLHGSEHYFHGFLVQLGKTTVALVTFFLLEGSRTLLYFSLAYLLL